MPQENWKITYHLQKQDGRMVRVREAFQCAKGYHRRFKAHAMKLTRAGGVGASNPVYKVRNGNYLELLALGMEGGRTLPLIPKPHLTGAILVTSERHPITLTAPDGTRYIKRFHNEAD